MKLEIFKASLKENYIPKINAAKQKYRFNLNRNITIIEYFNIFKEIYQLLNKSAIVLKMRIL